jgi:rRNA maturation endonuclease Nob1
MKWHECESCLSEFRVVSDTDDPIQYCPFCGSEIDHKEEQEIEEDLI